MFLKLSDMWFFKCLFYFSFLFNIFFKHFRIFQLFGIFSPPKNSPGSLKDIDILFGVGWPGDSEATRWLTTTAPQLLRWYCVYVCCMGLCGISEAFVRAVANSGELHVFKSFPPGCLSEPFSLAHNTDTRPQNMHARAHTYRFDDGVLPATFWGQRQFAGNCFVDCRTSSCCTSSLPRRLTHSQLLICSNESSEFFWSCFIFFLLPVNYMRNVEWMNEISLKFCW